ncbi:MAG: helix-turn-helix domain-containing protein, partial [Nitrospiria bacterium]
MKPDPLYIELGKLIRAHRRRIKFTQDQLAERVGLSRTSITNIERGGQKVLLHQLYALARHLEIPPESLLPQAGALDSTNEIAPNLLKHFKGAEKDWARRIVGPTSTKGGRPDVS